MKSLISVTLSAFFAGCAFPLSHRTTIDSFQVELGRRARWTEGRHGFDPALPGYHVTGDIASIVLRPRSTRRPDKMVIAITTSPGARPMLENFSVATKDTLLSSSLFKNAGVTEITNRRTGTQVVVKKGEYFRLKLAEDEALVTFLPKAMALLEGDITISWIDWYRQ